MKATHEQVVKTIQSMGYEIVDQYPMDEITVLKSASGFMTVKNSTWKPGSHPPKN